VPIPATPADPSRHGRDPARGRARGARRLRHRRRQRRSGRRLARRARASTSPSPTRASPSRSTPALLAQLAAEHELLVTVEEGVAQGGFGTAVWECLSEGGLAPRILRVGLPDRYVTHGRRRSCTRKSASPPSASPSASRPRCWTRAARSPARSSPLPYRGGRPVSAAVPGSVSAVPRVRLDSLLAERGLFESRSRAAAAVLAGEVRLGSDGRRAEKAGQLVDPGVELAVDAPPPYVSRGASSWPTRSTRWALRWRPRLPRRRRLHRWLHGLPVAARSGAHRGAGRRLRELDFRLRGDERVTVLERVNARSCHATRCPTRRHWWWRTSPSSP
jgi:hypothetical protein